MKLGCCMGIDRIFEDGRGTTAVRILESGYDYVELALAPIAALSDGEFADMSAIVKNERIVVYACNVFFPGEIKLVGENVEKGIIVAYLKKVFERADHLSTRVLVVGSSGSRNVPEGFPREMAWAQLLEVFNMIADEAALYGITVVIEPLNTRESNIINSLAEGRKLTDEVGRSNIKLLADFYHMAVENEDINLEAYGDVLRHTHFAEPEGRVFPKVYRDTYKPFFDGLKKINYSGGISMECGSNDLLADATAAAKILRNC